MAEPLNTNAAKPASSSSKVSSRVPSPLLENISAFLKIITWLAIGLVFLFLGVICKIKKPVPASWEPFLALHIPHLPYFLCGFGLLFLAHARSLLRREYEAGQKNGNPLYPHAWKVSLLGTQVFLLYISGIYAILFGINKLVPPIGMLGLVFFIVCFLLYLLWYQIEYFKNRLPAFAALRISMMAFVFAGISFLLWTFYQMIIPSIIMAFLAICAGLYSLGYSGHVSQKGSWFKYIFMIATVAFLGVIGYYVQDFWKPQITPLDTVAVTQGMRGNLSNLLYSPQGNEIVFTRELQNHWFLQMVNPDKKAPVTFALKNVDDDFHVFFAENGQSLLMDAPHAGKRQLLKMDLASQTLSTLVKTDIEPFSGGEPWLDSTNQFLFVTRHKKDFCLNVWTMGKNKPTVLYSSPESILSPAWIDSNDIVYGDGVYPMPYLLNVKEKMASPVLTREEMVEQPGVIETAPLVEVLPSPDHFRYLCVAHLGDQTILWSMLMDGSKRVELYKTNEQLSNISWLADGQKIIFQRTGLQRGFKYAASGIVVLDANLGTFEDLIPAQVNCHTPAGSPDGVKIAFVGSEGLWYPSLDSSVWVAVLR